MGKEGTFLSDGDGWLGHGVNGFNPAGLWKGGSSAAFVGCVHLGNGWETGCFAIVSAFFLFDSDLMVRAFLGTLMVVL